MIPVTIATTRSSPSTTPPGRRCATAVALDERLIDSAIRALELPRPRPPPLVSTSGSSAATHPSWIARSIWC